MTSGISYACQPWAGRFEITAYTPRDPAYGKWNNGITSTGKKADPKKRIVAVDPKVIPYGSEVWIADLGKYHAEDTGGAIKGRRLDVLVKSRKEAFALGRQTRYTVVIPACRTQKN